MYGRLLAAVIPETRWHEESPFIITSDDFGRINAKNLDIVQDAYVCCSGQLPVEAHPGEVWICNICDRIWAVPSTPNASHSWVLTRLCFAESHDRDMFAFNSYKWWRRSMWSVVISVLASSIVLLVNTSTEGALAMYLSFGTLMAGFVITAFTVYKWRKLLNQYNLSISES